MPLFRRGLGYLEDKPDKRDWDIDRLGIASSDLPAECSLKEHVPFVLDQGASNSCVAQVFAAGINLIESKNGLRQSNPSRLFLYWNSRRSHGKHWIDGGTYLRTCAKMMSKLGCPDEQYWRFSTSMINLNRRPPWQSYMQAHPRMGGSYYRIFDFGDARLSAIKASICAGHPVGFGVLIRRSFQRNSGPSIIDRIHIGDREEKEDPLAGGHAMLIVGYKWHPQYGSIFQIQNSWSDRWRDGGFAWMTGDYLTAAFAQDFQIIRGWRRLGEM